MMKQFLVTIFVTLVLAVIVAVILFVNAQPGGALHQ